MTLGLIVDYADKAAELLLELPAQGSALHGAAGLQAAAQVLAAVDAHLQRAQEAEGGSGGGERAAKRRRTQDGLHAAVTGAADNLLQALASAAKALEAALPAYWADGLPPLLLAVLPLFQAAVKLLVAGYGGSGNAGDHLGSAHSRSDVAALAQMGRTHRGVLHALLRAHPGLLVDAQFAAPLLQAEASAWDLDVRLARFHLQRRQLAPRVRKEITVKRGCATSSTMEAVKDLDAAQARLNPPKWSRSTPVVHAGHPPPWPLTPGARVTSARAWVAVVRSSRHRASWCTSRGRTAMTQVACCASGGTKRSKREPKAPSLPVALQPASGGAASRHPAKHNSAAGAF